MIPATARGMVAATLVALLAVSHADEIPPIEGTWLSGDGDGWIEIGVTGTGLSGVITGSPDDSEDQLEKDEHNPDPALRDRPLIGLNLFAGFRYDGEGRWKDGTIYDPTSGKTYRCIVTFVDDNTLKVRGYIGVPMLGRSETWTRVED